MYRAKRVDTGKWVYGYYVKLEKHEKISLIVPKEAFLESLEQCGRHNSSAIFPFYKIDPTTLARNTTVKDKTGKFIYGSFEYEDGKMSEGGDRVIHEHPYLDTQTVMVKYENASFYPLRCLNNSFEIIGPACDAGE